MKTSFYLFLAAVVTSGAIFADDDIQPVSINISKKTPVSIADYTELKTYANNNNYYFSVNLKEGMRVLYSASYGTGEAGQASGTVVLRDGKYYFRQTSMATNQLLLPPGLMFNSSTGDSLWDLGAYMDLINRVSFSDPNESSRTANDIYDKPQAYLVDFQGGTAGKSVTYSNSLQVGFTKSVGNRSQSSYQVYYAKGIGPVALEFTETMTPSGTFKFYLGE